MAAKATHFSNISAEMSGEKMISPTLFSSDHYGKCRADLGYGKQVDEPARHPSQAAFALRPPDARDGLLTSSRRNWMASDVPNDFTNASSVCSGLADIRNPPLSAAATALAERAPGAVSSTSCVGTKKC